MNVILTTRYAGVSLAAGGLVVCAVLLDAAGASSVKAAAPPAAAPAVRLASAGPAMPAKSPPAAPGDSRGTRRGASDSDVASADRLRR